MKNKYDNRASSISFSLNCYFVLIFVLIISIFPVKVCAKDGQIDLDEIIQRKEAEMKAIEKITSTLHQVSGRFDPTTRNEDDEIVKDDDTSDEINIDYFVNILSDHKIYEIIKEFIQNFANYIENEPENKEDKNESPFLLFSIIYIVSFGIAMVISSISTVSSKETSNFNMVMKGIIPDLSELDMKNSLIVENQFTTLSYENINQNNVERNYGETIQNNHLDKFQQIEQLAISSLESFSNDDELKRVYKYYKKSRVRSGRALEDAIMDADEALKSYLSQCTNIDLLPLLIISQHTNKSGGNEIYNSNQHLPSLDVSYLEALSANHTEFDNKIWSENLNNEDN